VFFMLFTCCNDMWPYDTTILPMSNMFL
jgi:hypothetical protein